ncbi:hypothetical protein LCGC14_0972880 [marine sediment metagenome]|uniref:Uncharacterized protein n=1 Tax=marine sediment metagenome TaxID=412755 RepID=A0A0F9QUC1_9ZZZZ
MSQAVICPVCNGCGKAKEYEADTKKFIKDYPCHGCSGKGWVEVGGDVTYPIYPYPMPYYPYWPNWQTGTGTITFLGSSTTQGDFNKPE